MDKIQAQNIIKETFERPFEKERFTYFIKNLLNCLEEKTFIYKGNLIPDAFEQYISTLCRIGKYSDEEHEIDVLIIKLKKETSIERARTMQRNFIAWYLNGSRGGVLKDAALAAFVSPTNEDWRFSLVKMDYRFEEGKRGQIKVKEEFTPARRWSFLVGVNEKSHTAQSRLVHILADDEHNPALAQLEEAFNVEKVSKEFFEKYRGLFVWTKKELDKIVKNDPKVRKDFESKDVDTVNFAKKLLGQIVFLYFLQKKGWFGVSRDADWGTGSKQYLRELFDKKHCRYDNFFNDILESLFYEALRIDRSYDDDYYSRFNSKIPFLNGGLFDPINNYDWVHTDILLPNELFSNNKKTKEGDTGSGIMDIFDRYNFTVKEDEPLDKEVAIDPEMLGKAYEKFNAIRLDNYDEYVKALESGKKGSESKFNKQYGVYYTPREIVHYMCQQSLINFLCSESNQIDAFGNEAKKGQQDLTIEHRSTLFVPRNAIEVLIKYGEHVSENEERVLNEGRETDTYFYKLPESIRENAQFIDEKLADIKVCDPAVGSGAFPVGMMSEIVKTRNVLTTFLKGPNRTIYKFKRECIEKSLYGVDVDSGAVEIAKLRLWLSLVVDEEDIKQIKPLPNLDYKIVCGNSLFGVKKDLFNAALFTELENIKKLFFSETNPTKKKEYKENIDKLIIQITKGHKEFDFEVYFSEVFHKNKGFDIVIANPPYEEISKKSDKEFYQAIYCDVLSGHYDLYIFFFRKAFDVARKDGIIVFITSHTYIHYPQFKNLRKWLYEHSNIIEITGRIHGIFEDAVVDNAIILLQAHKTNTSATTIFMRKEIKKERLISSKKWMLNKTDFDYENFDIEVIENRKVLDKFRINCEPLGRITQSSQGITIYARVQGKKKNWLRQNPVDGCSKPVVRGRNISAYFIKWSDTYIQYGDWLWCPRDHKFFDSAKLFFRQTADSLIGTYVNEPMYCLDSIHSIIQFDRKYDLKYILAILNSRLGNYMYKLMIPETGKVFAQVKLAFLRQLPIKILSSNKQQPLANLVDKILATTKDDDYIHNSAKLDKVEKYERQIDQMVYELYGLTEEEIKIVEKSLKG